MRTSSIPIEGLRDLDEFLPFAARSNVIDEVIYFIRIFVGAVIGQGLERCLIRNWIFIEHDDVERIEVVTINAARNIRTPAIPEDDGNGVDRIGGFNCLI